MVILQGPVLASPSLPGTHSVSQKCRQSRESFNYGAVDSRLIRTRSASKSATKIRGRRRAKELRRPLPIQSVASFSDFLLTHKPLSESLIGVRRAAAWWPYGETVTGWPTPLRPGVPWNWSALSPSCTTRWQFPVTIGPPLHFPS